MGGQGEHAADIIIDHAHFDAGAGFFGQDIQDGVPHDAFFNDKIFEKDIMLSIFQIADEIGK